MRRDYFWVFCHPTNTIWDLAQTDEERVEKPRAPGGMTGGVEFEAMTYMVRSKDVHLLARADRKRSARQLTSDFLIRCVERQQS